MYHCKLITGNDNCMKWSQTAGCDPNGNRQPAKDKSCQVSINDNWSGYCECRDGSKKMKKGCQKGAFRTCAIACDFGKDNMLVFSGDDDNSNVLLLPLFVVYYFNDR